VRSLLATWRLVFVSISVETHSISGNHGLAIARASSAVGASTPKVRGISPLTKRTSQRVKLALPFLTSMTVPITRMDVPENGKSHYVLASDTKQAFGSTASPFTKQPFGSTARPFTPSRHSREWQLSRPD